MTKYILQYTTDDGHNGSQYTYGVEAPDVETLLLELWAAVEAGKVNDPRSWNFEFQGGLIDYPDESFDTLDVYTLEEFFTNHKPRPKL